MNPWWKTRLFVKWLIQRLHLGWRLIEYCKRCGVKQPLVWWCGRDSLWKEVTGGTGNVFCPECFDHLAMKKHILLRWYPEEEFRGD